MAAPSLHLIEVSPPSGLHGNDLRALIETSLKETGAALVESVWAARQHLVATGGDRNACRPCAARRTGDVHDLYDLS
ncbi:MAG TPA: hypothetical protein VHG72_19140 [Polyangia bacterium]|nr:hypothetical protein [Polyangia bacterium]